MTKYISNRQRDLKIGITSYTENLTVLEVTGGAYISSYVGLGTTNPTQSLHVQGNVRIAGGLYDNNNNVGTAGSILSSTGSGISWIAAASAGISTYADRAGIATYADVAGIATYATNAGIATYATNAGIATYATNAGIATYATNAGIATYATNAGIATYADVAGIATYATNAGIATYATNAGIATYADVAGIATYATNAGIATYATNAGIATYADVAGIATYATNAGIATYADVAGIATYATNAGIATYATNAGIATYATNAGIATYADVAGIATYATNAGIATYATNAGIATYATNAGIATYATNAGIATYATNAGIATYATNAGIATYADVAGIATYATNAGVSTSVIGGIGSITELYVSGISTLGTVLISSGIVTATVGVVTYYGDGSKLTDINASSIAGTLNYANNAGVSTSVIGGIGSITELYVSGISTLGTVLISSGIVTATVGVVTYYGDGSKLTGIQTSGVVSVVNQDPNTPIVYPTLVNNVGVSSLGISTTKLSFIPSSGKLGLGTVTPRENLDVIGTIGIQSAGTSNRFYLQHNSSENSLDFIFV